MRLMNLKWCTTVCSSQSLVLLPEYVAIVSLNWKLSPPCSHFLLFLWKTMYQKQRCHSIWDDWTPAWEVLLALHTWNKKDCVWNLGEFLGFHILFSCPKINVDIIYNNPQKKTWMRMKRIILRRTIHIMNLGKQTTKQKTSCSWWFIQGKPRTSSEEGIMSAIALWSIAGT